MASLQSPTLGGLLPESGNSAGVGLGWRHSPALAKLQEGKTFQAKRGSAQSAQVERRNKNAEATPLPRLPK